MERPGVREAQARAMRRIKHDNPAKWYARHLEQATDCRCTDDTADVHCDQGEALIRLARYCETRPPLAFSLIPGR